MNILAIESSGIVASACILNEEKIIAEFTTNNKLTHGENLVPLIKSMLEFSEMSLDDIDYVACANGPGSFVGLRIGVSVAKSIAHSINKPIIPVPTLDAMAYNTFGKNLITVPIIDAKRNQLYVAYYDFIDGKQVRLNDYSILTFDKISEDLSCKNKKIMFLGEGVALYKEEILSNKNFSIPTADRILQNASSVGMVALDRISENISYSDFKPFYIRLSQAERDFGKE